MVEDRCRSTVRAIVVSALVLVAIVGCHSSEPVGPGSGSGTGGGIGTDGGEPLSAFVDDFIAAYCAPLVTCGVFVDVPSCRAGTDFERSLAILTTIGDVGRGSVLYDPVAGAACIAGLPQDCSITANARGSAEAALQILTSDPTCTGVFKGTEAPGAACNVGSLECNGPLFCSGAAGSGVCTNRNGCCLGVCPSTGSLPPAPQLGESCPYYNCQAPGVCEGGVCSIPPAEGAACVTYFEVPCASLTDYCSVADGGTSGVCVPRVAAGAPCAPSVGAGGGSTAAGPCVLDAQCLDDGTGTGTNRCVIYAGLGAPCAASTACNPPLGCTNGACTNPDWPSVDCGG